jgi:hypothetical protein
VLPLLRSTLFQGFEQKTVDARMRLRGSAEAAPEVVVCAIDAESVDRIGQWPWSRTVLAELVDRLRSAGARASGSNHGTAFATTFNGFDEAKAKEFYVGFLGFAIDWEHRFGENFPLYMQVSKDGCVIHLTGHHGDGCPGAAVRIATTGLKEFCQQLREKDYKHAKPGCEPTEWKTLETSIKDPFGNTALRPTVVEKDASVPCRVCLEDARIGESVLLFSYGPFDKPAPHQTLGPVYVHATPCTPFRPSARLPEVLRHRLVAFRAYNEEGTELVECDVVEGAALEARIEKVLENPRVHRINVHFARAGCFACSIERSGR